MMTIAKYTYMYTTVNNLLLCNVLYNMLWELCGSGKVIHTHVGTYIRTYVHV